MAKFDMVAKQTTYRQQLLDFFPQALSFRPGFQHENAHGIAAAQAYETYSDPLFLDWARLAWVGGEFYTISEEELRSGRFRAKPNAEVFAKCAEVPMAGGTFEKNDTVGSFVNAFSTGSYIITSSMLAEAAQNRTYLESGSIISKNFTYNQLRNSQGVLLDGIWADCRPGDLTSPTDAVGAMIEGLAILLSLSKQEDTFTSKHLEEIVYKAVSKVEWYNAEGILLVDGGDILKIITDARANAQLVGQYVIRGLSTIYIRNISQPALRPYIQKYLAVQYNAVLSNARGLGVNNNIYGASWAREQQVSDFSFEQQTNALSILVAAVSIRNDTNLPGEKPSEPPPGLHPARPRAAVIAGVAVAVTVTVVLFSAGLATWLVRRRKLRRTGSTDGGLSPTHNRIDAYDLTSGHRKPKSGARKEGKRLTSQGSEGAPGIQLSGVDAASNVVQRGVRESDNGISTADLVRVLNQRLQGREWRQDEPPPDYFNGSEEAPAGRDGSTGQKRAIVM
ncbi:hypothetical protein PQX77_011486 [Marasmius sp. AFHP31]|nr:hypothetical protein PQX77_011486 [Marasmius sp. AFHP31]